LAILSLGYADGFLRAAGSSDARKGASVVIAGRKCPLVGRVSMDLVAADISDLPAGSVARGDFATVLGDDITIDDLARAAGTIGYEVLTRLGPRFIRTYVS
jgi:alanine racemase